MPVVNVNLLVDDKTYADIQLGVLELCGLAKNVDNKRIARHIPTVADAAKEGAAKAIDTIREHKKGMLLIGGVIIVGAVAGTFHYVVHINNRKLDKKFGESLQIYLDTAKAGNLTIETLESLINSIEALERKNPSNQLTLNISSKQFNDLINCIFDYTKRLSAANQINIQNIKRPTVLKNKTSDDLKYYLSMQKQIFEHAS